MFKFKRHARAHAIGVSTSMFALLAAAPAMAQEDTETKKSTSDILIEEISITSTKKSRSENLQSVPIAVTAFGEAQLDALQVRNFQSLSYNMPNVQLEDVGTTKGFANFSIRGLGVNSSIPSIDPAVGVFIDGMYLGSTAGVVFDTFDLESVEVLRGPQGVLFGRNVTGGALVANTSKPTEEFSAKAKVALDSGLRGTGANYYAMGRVSGAITPDKFRVKLAAYYNKDEGWHENLADGSNIGASETVIIRPAFTFLPNENVELTVRMEHGDVSSDGPVAQNHSIYSRNSFDASIDEVGFNESKWDQVITELNWDVGFGEDGRVTNIFAWRDLELDSLVDIDSRSSGDIIVGLNPVSGLPVVAPLPFLFHAYTEIKQDQWSNELRYSGRFADTFDLTTGFYYFTQDMAYFESRFLPTTGDFSGGGTQDHETWGIFATADIDLTDRLTMTVGGRFTKENKSAAVVPVPLNRVDPTFQVNLPVSPGLCNLIENIDQCVGVDRQSDSWDFFTPRVGLNYAASDSTQLYANWTRGFRAGGYNLRRTLVAFPFSSFDPERIDNFEAGAKYVSEDRRVKLNVATFFMDIANIQRDINLADPFVGVGQATLNTADAEIMGIEAEGQWVVTDNLILTGQIGIVDGDYQNVTQDISGDGVINEVDANLDIPRLAELSWGLGAIYDIQLNNGGGISTRVNFNHRDETAFTDNNLGILNAADMLDASISWRMADERFTLTMYGRNLLNETTFGGVTLLPEAFQSPTQRTGDLPTFSPLNKGAVFGLELQFQM